MQQIEIGENEAGQRLDKFLQKFMPLAPSSFFYKMLRKKNITLNGKKAEGKEKLALGDKISFYLADETIAGFCDKPGKGETINEYQAAYRKGIPPCNDRSSAKAGPSPVLRHPENEEGTAASRRAFFCIWERLDVCLENAG